ncbi:hypothetical protein NE237_008922 [Protea cynaroides]|uniref:Uncharacterized protein n=1 Tax=Protea cynaroides TaxID=273540 RepID=A0A9Q0KWH6_9MAGN|nr:hypothetical protein NE237_008922 [Protea cynaroides]
MALPPYQVEKAEQVDVSSPFTFRTKENLCHDEENERDSSTVRENEGTATEISGNSGDKEEEVGVAVFSPTDLTNNGVDMDRKNEGTATEISGNNSDKEEELGVSATIFSPADLTSNGVDMDSLQEKLAA